MTVNRETGILDEMLAWLSFPHYKMPLTCRKALEGGVKWRYLRLRLGGKFWNSSVGSKIRNCMVGVAGFMSMP